MRRELTCIVCPIGCNLVAEIADSTVVSVSGNTCPKGKTYAETECVAPMRTVTTTLRCKTGEILPVKTDRTIPKDKIFKAIKIINQVHPVLPIQAGNVIIKDVFGSNIVATKNIN